MHEYVELLDSLGVDKFFVTGASMGGSWAICVAAALPGRVLGCAPISCMADARHPSVAKKDRGALCGDAGSMTLSIGESGCMGGMMRSMIAPYFKVLPSTSKDPGFAKKYISYFKYGDASGKKYGPFEAMDTDPFLVSSLLDSWLHGVNGTGSNCGLTELIRIFGKQGWGYDPATIQCPTFIYHGNKDMESPVKGAEHLHGLIKGSELIVVPETSLYCGHVTILCKAPEIIQALVEKKKAEIA